MKLSVVLALFIIFQLGAASLMRNWMFDFEKELEHDYDDSEIGFHNIHSLMARSRRGDKVKICGTKVLKMVMVMCGGECSSTNENIATECCEKMCTMEDITTKCCPSR